MSGHILVVGSLNMDLVTRVAHLPTPGETVLGSDLERHPGGKGANQAVAAARAGAAVEMVGCIGGDDFGDRLLESLKRAAVGARYLQRREGASGVALITVDAEGENAIVLSPGANGRFTAQRLESVDIASADLVMVQLEIPFETVQKLLKLAKAAEVPVMLNAAPARELGDDSLAALRYLIVNETEAALLSGRKVVTEPQALGAARHLRQKGVNDVVVTLGKNGLVWSGLSGEGRLPAHRVEVVDTTAAGDAFCGALAARLVGGYDLREALRFANAAAALATTKPGAQPSLPGEAQILALLAEAGVS